MKTCSLVLLVCVTATSAASQTPSNDRKPLLRRYHEGEELTYHMKATNEGRRYEAQADGIVKKDSAGNYFEEYRWSNLIFSDQKVALPPASLEFRQLLSLDPNYTPAPPNLSQVDPKLIGPITDFMTFYVDLWLAVKAGQLVHAGDHFYFKRGAAGSWADGHYTLLGQSSIDFDMTLTDLNTSGNAATLLVRHVPPEKPQIKLPADWMHKPVADTANNWVQVQRTNGGKFSAAVGKETFDVKITISLTDVKILSANMGNLVQTIERQCDDETLTKCGDPHPHSIQRNVEISQ